MHFALFVAAALSSDALELAEDHPLERWLRAAASSGAPAVSGYAVLAGNSSAHEHALRRRLRRDAASELQYLSHDAAWRAVSCAEGCESLSEADVQTWLGSPPCRPCSATLVHN